MWSAVWDLCEAGTPPDELENQLFDATGHQPWEPIAPPLFNVVLRNTTKDGPEISGQKAGLLKRTFIGNISQARWGSSSYKGNQQGLAPIWEKWRDWGANRAPLEGDHGMKRASRNQDEPGLLFIGFVDNACIDTEPDDAVANGHESYHKTAIGLAIPKGGPTYKSLI
jgi:hypothetical protein